MTTRFFFLIRTVAIQFGTSSVLSSANLMDVPYPLVEIISISSKDNDEASDDKRIYLFSRTSSTPVWTFEGQLQRLSPADISADGNKIVAVIAGTNSAIITLFQC